MKATPESVMALIARIEQYGVRKFSQGTCEVTGDRENAAQDKAVANGYLAEIIAEVERLAQSAPTGLTDMGWVIDAATKGELAAYDQGIAESIQAVTKILDGKDAGAGIANRPWEPLRRRLLALAAQSAPLAQQAAREYPPLPPTLKCKPNEYCLAQHHVSLFTANQMRAYVDADRAAAQVEPGETLNVPVQPMKAENPPPA